VKTDSKATVKFSGLLGQNYVAIGFGSPQASKAETDTELATVEQPDLSALMARLENVASGVEDVTKSFSGIKLGDFLAVTMDVLNENRADIRTTITNLQTISSRIVEGEGTVGLLIKEKALYDSALAAMTNLNDSVSQIKGVVDQAKTTISKINEGQGTIGLLATDTALYAEATNAMTNLREILEKINRGQGSIGKLVNDESLYKNARMTLQKLDKATEGLEDQGPLSVLGVAVNSLF
jgi:phospholipid/cholesterol/gamma-HCH transport system substrate-binding protein